MNQVIQIDFKKERVLRQNKNNKKVLQALINNDLDNCNFINIKELNRVILELQDNLDESYTKEKLLRKCSTNKESATLLAGRISKRSNRQGNKDETTQLEVCNKIAQKYNIIIEQLNNNAMRALKNNNRIISSEELKEEKIDIHDCLKSFDAEITGRLEGYFFAKVVIGGGGHQDNVFREAMELGEWVKNYGCDIEKLFVILIDTDNINKPKFEILKKKFHDVKNIIVVNHVEFQEYLIQKYNDNI
uniref:Uncharacterized protein n=1 Tax=Megaviridae environmental sample TaxID=1737588 RepID=A0A5J6VIW5_9VIRU|nr:MAG: hypothetical protein [Megaviridae environmental sample]